MADPVLLDTCAILWIAEGASMGEPALDMISEARQARVGVYVSTISAWEIGTLVRKRRITQSINTGTWWSKFIAKDGIRVLELDADTLIASTQLPGSGLSDPADCIIAASARHYGLTVVTRDAKLLDYAAQGHMRALRC